MKDQKDTLVSIALLDAENNKIFVEAIPVINTSSHSNSKVFTNTSNKFFFFIFDPDDVPSFWNKNIPHKIDVACFSLAPAVCHSFFQLQADSDTIVSPNIQTKYAIIAPFNSLRFLGIDLGAIIVDFNVIEGDADGQND